jgi:hypothetical protein
VNVTGRTALLWVGAVIAWALLIVNTLPLISWGLELAFG